MSKKHIKKANKAKFKVPTKVEEAHDRKHYLSAQIIDKIQKGHDLVDMMHNLAVFDEIIKFRMNQLGVDKDGKETKESEVLELFEGAPKPRELLRAQVMGDLHTRNTQLMAFTRIKEQFVKEFGFTEDQVKEILTEKFNWNKWQDEKEKAVKTENSKYIG